MTRPAEEQSWVIYDAQCPMCRNLVRRAQAWGDPGVHYVDGQEGAARFPEIRPAALTEALHLVEPDGEVYKGAGAIFRLLARRGGAWRLPCWIYRRVPGAARACEAVYRLVARRRRRTPGRESVQFVRPRE